MLKTSLLSLLIMICVFRSIRTLESCVNPEISLTQKIDNEGFHRELRWLLERTPNTQWNSKHCKYALKFDITKEIYLNPDEIAKIKQLSILIKGKVDVEVPAHVANASIAYIYIPSDLDKISITLPFHLRYQRAQISGKYGKVILNRPSILGMCPLSCQIDSKIQVEAPCTSKGISECKWMNLTYHALFDQVELYVPVGDLDDYPLVSIVTLLLGCAGCIYTLSILSTTPL